MRSNPSGHYLQTLFLEDLVAVLNAFVILNLFQDNMRRLFVILKQVQDDEGGVQDGGGGRLFGDDACVTVILKVNVIA